jgi:hypothetical protein
MNWYLKPQLTVVECYLQEKLSSSKSPVEAFIGDRLQSDAIPVLEKLQKVHTSFYLISIGCLF